MENTLNGAVGKMVDHARAGLKVNTLGKTIKVLDHGYVKLFDYMGDDERIVTAARMSTSQGAKTPEEDAKLIDYLLRNRHTSPFEQVEFVFIIKMPIFVARQWVRHRTASLNEVSGRYIEFDPEFFVPEDLRIQAKINHQASEEGVIANQEDILREMRAEQALVKGNYEEYLSDGVARELARINLPLSTYTEMMWKMDLHNLFHFLSLRDEAHAQKEIRDYAVAIAELIQPIVPAAYAAYERHTKNGVKLSAEEVEVIKEILSGFDAEDAMDRRGERFARIFKEKFGL